MSHDTTLSSEQQAFLEQIPTPGTWPSNSMLATWFKEKPFRRRYVELRDAMMRQVILLGMQLWVDHGKAIHSAPDPNRKDREKHLAEFRRCALRLLLSERSRRRRGSKKSEPDLDDLSFEEVIAKVIRPGADLARAVAFFKSRLSDDPPPDQPEPPPAPPAQQD